MGAKSCGIKEDFVTWCHQWLKTAGLNVIEHEITEEDGKIKEFKVKQSCYKHGEKNRLRKQAY